MVLEEWASARDGEEGHDRCARTKVRELSLANRMVPPFTSLARPPDRKRPAELVPKDLTHRKSTLAAVQSLSHHCITVGSRPT